MLKFWQRVVRSKWTKLLAVACGSHRFWLGTALAATLVVVAQPSFAAETGSAIVYGGGTVSFNNAAATNWIWNAETGAYDLLLKFTADQAGSFQLPGITKARILAIGGGGGGGGAYKSSSSFTGYYGGGAGGGAGGMVESNLTFTADAYTVNVGLGGKGGTYGTLHLTTGFSGKSGENTTVFKGTEQIILAYGGGGGGGEHAGLDGGSSGGGSLYRNSATKCTTNYYGNVLGDGQGNRGGIGNAGMWGAGGGGAGDVGADADKGATGGDGRVSNITGADVWYAGGGGGGHTDKTITDSTLPPIAGGKGGGGRGGVGLGVEATPGDPETGGGGGGCNANTSTSAGASGGSGVVYVRISASVEGEIRKPISPALPIEYDGEEHVLIKAHPAYDILVGGVVIVGDAAWMDVGTYTATARLKPGFSWTDDGSTDPVTVSMTIKKAQAVIEHLNINDWVAGTPVDATPDAMYVVRPDFATVTVDYGESATGPWSATKPTDAGSYVVRATVPTTEAYDGTVATAMFRVLPGPGDRYTDHVDITNVLYTTDEEATDYPFVIALSEALPAAAGLSPYGFLYDRAGVDGETLCFTDKDGNVLPYQVMSWDVNGVSKLCVRLPVPQTSTAPQTIRLFWHLRESKKAPEHTYEPTETPVERTDYRFDLIVRDNLRVNYWLDKPQMTKTAWDSRETPGVIDPAHRGTLAEGTIAQEVINSFTGESMGTTLPTTQGGAYRVNFTPNDPKGIYEPLLHYIDISITGHYPVEDLKGEVDDLTLNGRVLLANDDKAAGYEVTGQAYWRVREVGGSTLNTYWTHENPVTLSSTFKNLLGGTTKHILRHIGDGNETNILWRLNDVFIGNTVYNDVLYSGQCYLPWSATGLGNSSYDVRETAGKMSEAGNLVLRNVVDAQVISPCYMDGIGTIYFDIVNGWTEGTADEYAIVVEMATTTSEGKIPTDANTGPDLEKLGPNEWIARTMIPFKRDGTPDFMRQASTKELDVYVTGDLSTNNFYRVCVSVNYNGPSRFRIRRLRKSSAFDENTGGFILLDNLIVSYPKMTASLTPYGEYQEPTAANRKQILGQKAAMSVPFPAISQTDVKARAKSVCVTSALTNVDEKTFITLAKMHYRWRYLNQVAREEDWKTIDLQPMNDFVSEEPLVIPDSEGDVEFWYEGFTQIPYYRYHDYSGLGRGLTNLYTEESGVITNRIVLSSTEWLASAGTNWFFRLRPGKSDFEGVTMEVAGQPWLKESSLKLELAGDHTWRGFLMTPTNAAGNVRFRFRGTNPQTPGDDEYVHANVYWKLQGDAPLSVGGEKGMGTLVTCQEGDAWSELSVSNLANAVMIRIDDKALSFSAVYGARQDFATWSANPKDGKGLFVGQVEYDEAGASGSSDATTMMTAPLGTWHPSVSVDTNFWLEAFKVKTSDIGKGKTYPLGEPFGSILTPNRWTAGPGMWAAGSYNDPETGLALQMEGQGKGYLQFVNSGHTPRGLKSVSFTARLAQFQSFDDIAYWDDTDTKKSKFSNYTFITKAAFDTNERKNFAGAASVSVFAYYRSEIGAYELRVTQKNAKIEGGVATAAGTIKTLQLFRWSVDATTKKLVAEQLGTDYDVDADAMLKTKGETTSSSFSSLFISCSNLNATTTLVYAGVTRSGQVPGTTTASASAMLAYKDANAAKRLTSGTFGLTSANSPSRFTNPIWYDQALWRNTVTEPSDNQLGKISSATPTWRGTKRECYLAMRAGEWIVPRERLDFAELTSDTPSLVGFKATAHTETLKVFTAEKGTEAWDKDPIATFDVSSFGSSGQSAVCTIPLYAKDDRSVKIAMGGDFQDSRCDVVIDDVQIEQWRGESFDDEEGATYFPEVNYGSPTNFVFTQAWILTNVVGETNCQLNAKRSLKSVATSVRSPLFDGREGRGTGLGTIAFSYANMSPNARVCVQIATNSYDITTLNELSKSTRDADWTTLTNLDYSALGASGTYAHYVGLHGVKGSMRIALDPTTVDDVAAETDPNRFGSIDILGVTCSDEPELDARSWWGWNLRTTDETNRLSLADQPLKDGPAGGQAFALNNSVTNDIRKEYGDTYSKHLPFLQTPALSAQLIGEVSYKARRYDAGGADAWIYIYGASGGREPDKDWTLIASNAVPDDIYRTYSFKMPQGARYASLRFAVVAVPGITPDPETGNGYMPGSREEEAGADKAVRILLDDVIVSESIDARVAFRNVRPFRFGLDNALAIADIMSENEQPLVGEAWGVQGEIYAAQLVDEVDLSRAQVRLSWYVGKDLWGYDQWKDSPSAQSAWLAESSDTERIYRSSYRTCPSAVVPMVDKTTTVQYMLEVIWKTRDGKTTVTNRMESSDWLKPDWYRGLDYNAQYGGNDPNRFAGYTILDTVAPHWAWVNEANVLGVYDDDLMNSDTDYQYVEIAAPAEADLTGWSIRMLEADTANREVITNTIATFGDPDLDGLKKDLLGQASGMVFRVVGSPATWDNPKISKRLGEIDGTWSFADHPTTTFHADGELNWQYPFGIQLVRPSGVVEHEVVLIGYNYWGPGSRYPEDYEPTNTVNALNGMMPGSRFFYAGDDNGGQPTSLSVCDARGETSNVWDRAMIRTPGRINTYADGTPQVLPPDHPTPAGDTIIVRCNLGGDGKLVQTVGTAVDSSVDQIVLLKKGSETGTNITYAAAAWYELGVVTTNGTPLPASARIPLGDNRWTVNVGKGMSNGFTVVANADVCEKLRDLGVDGNNRYKNAIMDWFEKGVDLYGNPWPDSDGEVYSVPFRDLSFNMVTNLSLTEMYWLDICPTLPNQHLVGGMSKAPEPLLVMAAPKPAMARRVMSSVSGADWPGLKSITNRQMSVYLAITNTNPVGSSDWRATYAPYVIRGMEPGYTSWDYATNKTAAVWTNGSFKVSGILMNGLTSKTNPLNWVPLRWFVFTEGSFFGPGCAAPHKPFTSEIEIQDPTVPGTPGYDAWGDWVEKNCGGIWPDVFFRWELNERQRMYDVEVLKPTNYLSE